MVKSHPRIGEMNRFRIGANIGAATGFADMKSIFGNDMFIKPGAKIFDIIAIVVLIVFGPNTVIIRT